MNESHAQFTGSIPEIYDTHLGPLLFEFTARDLVRRIQGRIPATAAILEVACGTGIATGHLRDALPASVTILATDLNDAMLQFARQKRGALTGVTFEVADALALSWSEPCFDAVVCQFGIMFFPDKLKGLREMARVLKPGGVLAFNVWDSLQANPAVALAQEVIARYFESEPPKFLQTPFGFHDTAHIRSLLAEAGLKDIECHVVSEVIGGRDAASVARGFVEGNPGVLEIQARASATPEAVTRALAEALEINFGPAPLNIPLQAIAFTATKPE